ncbi:hypothetical protein [Aliiroseovarius sp. Z3]|nr:hypothetical protein [Aliiroseovarius sp. Z3]
MIVVSPIHSCTAGEGRDAVGRLNRQVIASYAETGELNRVL